jgi:hypothetical protein
VGDAIDQLKVQAILDWPSSRWVRAVRAFLGLTGYYWRFIQDYGTIVASLMKLLCKDDFQWGTEAEAAFRALQQALTSALVLQLPNFDQPFIVECDASGIGVGGVLHQGRGPIAFFSKQLAPPARLASSV